MVIGMDHVRRACWRPKRWLVGAAIFASLFCGFVEPVRADVVVTPTALTIGIPTGQTRALGSITATNTGVASVTITWADAMPCLYNVTQGTHTLAAGASTVFTLEGVCPATGSATLSGTGVPTVTIPVHITTVPAIGLNPTSLAYAGTVGGTTSAHSIAISNVGGGTLTWSASSNVTWLTLSPHSGTNAGTITATMNPAGMVLAGSYTATVTVTAVGATTKTIPVTLTLTASTTSSGTSFSLSPLTLAYTDMVGSPNMTGSVTVTNTGSTTITVTWADSINWLVAITPGLTQYIQPGHSGTYTVTASFANLAAGSYSGTATISGGGIIEQVHVTLTALTSAANTAALTWNAVTDSDLAGYKVYLRTSAGSYAAPIATLPKTTTSYTVTGLQTDTTYFFVITSYDTAGHESLHSNEVSKTMY
jgi:fibronectin type III domain protein/BACON domain-containing protein